MSFNPFKNSETNTFETRSSPHAKTLRSTFWDKLNDTFIIFFGNPNKGPGLFDYMTLGLPLLLFFLVMECFSQRPKNDFRALKNIFIVPLVLVNIPLLLARFLVSIACTIIFSPIVLLVHVAAKIRASKDLKCVQEKMTQYPEAHRFIIESKKENNGSYSYTFHTLTSKEIEKGHFIGVQSEPLASITVSVSLFNKKAVIQGENKDLFQAFLKLNSHEVLTELEELNDAHLHENLKLLINAR